MLRYRITCAAILQCPNIESPDCLTKAQITTVKKIYSGPADDQGNHYYPGGQVFGSEFGWARGFVPTSGNFSLDYYLNLIT